MNINDIIGNADEFPILARWQFFNHAGVSPLPRRATDALRRYAAFYETDAYISSGFYRQIEDLRTSAARLIGANRDEIAFVKNTSEGIATVANAIDWQPGDRIVTTAVEYPANMYPWIDVQRRCGVELVTVAEQGGRIVIDDILAAAHHPRTRLVSLSHVEFGSGQRLDIAQVGAFCRPRRIHFCVDAIQSMGVLPIDVVAMNIDYLSADGHKWLLGPEGAGVFYCRRDLLESTRPLAIGWMNVVNDQDYDRYDLTLKPDARKFECGTHNIPGLLAFKASLELLLEIGVDACAAQLKALSDHLLAQLTAKGYQVFSPCEGESWSGIVSFASPVHDHKLIWRELRERHRTELAVRQARLRASPHVYNTIEQMDRLAEALPGH
jgi:selenocysteine lyase/cysteine desulfurase